MQCYTSVSRGALTALLDQADETAEQNDGETARPRAEAAPLDSFLVVVEWERTFGAGGRVYQTTSWNCRVGGSLTRAKRTACYAGSAQHR